MNGLFVTATGTDAGKTFVTAGLLATLRARGIPARALKPVVSGFDAGAPEGSDPALLLAAMGEAATPAAIEAIAPFRFTALLAPNMAARCEGRGLALTDILTTCRAQLAVASTPLLIEGVGGVMSPVTDDATCLDWIAALNLPVLVVAGTYLGAISHTLSAVAMLQARACTVAAIALNETPDGVGLAEMQAEIMRFLPGLPVVAIRRGATDFAELARTLGFPAARAPD